MLLISLVIDLGLSEDGGWAGLPFDGGAKADKSRLGDEMAGGGDNDDVDMGDERGGKAKAPPGGEENMPG